MKNRLDYHVMQCEMFIVVVTVGNHGVVMACGPPGVSGSSVPVDETFLGQGV